jgi:hypothetical protein
MKPLKITLALGLAALARVAPAQVPQRLPVAAVTASTSNTVTVQNDRKVPVTLALEYGSFSRELGTVPPLGVTSLPLPEAVVSSRSQVRFVAKPQGQVDNLATERFRLEPPGRLTVEIPAWGATLPQAVDSMTAIVPVDALKTPTVTVDNPLADPVTLIAEQGQFNMKLGEVPAHSQATLRVPDQLVGPTKSIRLFVRATSGGDLFSQTIRIEQGDHLGIKVPAR